MIGKRRGSRRRQQGQSMVEFALIAPMFFLMIFGIVEFGLLMFNVASSRYATGEAAKVEAYVGDTTKACGLLNGCTKLHPLGSYLCDADCQAIVAINNSPVGSTSLESVNWIEIRQCPNSSCPNPTCVDAAHTAPAGCTSGTYVIRTGADGCLSGPEAANCTTTYPAKGRSTSAATPEYLQVTLNYRYDWKTGILKAIHNAPVDLNSSYLIRIEPQSF